MNEFAKTEKIGWHLGKAEKREIGNVHPMPWKSLRIDALCDPADFREWDIEVLCYLAGSQSAFL